MFEPQPLAAQSLRRIHQVSPRASLTRSGFVHGGAKQSFDSEVILKLSFNFNDI